MFSPIGIQVRGVCRLGMRIPDKTTLLLLRTDSGSLDWSGSPSVT